MADKRYRIRQCFWLDVTKDEQLHMFEEIEGLKRRRKWTRFILDAITLMLSLMTGSDHKFKASFGDIWEGIYQQGAHDARSAMQAEHDARLAEVDRKLHALSMAIANLESGRVLPAPQRQFAAPGDDDDDANLVQATKRKSDGQSARNFLKALDALNGTRLAEAPPPVVNADPLPEPRRPARGGPGTGNAKQINGAGSLSLPVFDDDDDDDFAGLVATVSGD